MSRFFHFRLLKLWWEGLWSLNAGLGATSSGGELALGGIRGSSTQTLAAAVGTHHSIHCSLYIVIEKNQHAVDREKLTAMSLRATWWRRQHHLQHLPAHYWIYWRRQNCYHYLYGLRAPSTCPLFIVKNFAWAIVLRRLPTALISANSEQIADWLGYCCLCSPPTLFPNLLSCLNFENLIRRAYILRWPDGLLPPSTVLFFIGDRDGLPSHNIGWCTGPIETRFWVEESGQDHCKARDGIVMIVRIDIPRSLVHIEVPRRWCGFLRFPNICRLYRFASCDPAKSM